jgi:methionine-gamma-lyase
MKKETRITHPPEIKIPEGNVPIVTPVYRTVKFTYATIDDSLSQEAKEFGFDYTRDSNPTTRELELLAAELQDRDDAIATGSGMAAIWLALLGNLETGDRAVTFVESYRPNRVALRRFLPRLGVESTMLSVHDHEGLARVFADERTKLLLFEAPTNPMMQIPDLEAIVGLAQRHDVVTVLDNTFGGLHNHGRYGIDYFVHSMTKYANGHGDVMGGIVIGDKKRIKAIKPLSVNILHAVPAAFRERAGDCGVSRQAQRGREGVLSRTAERSGARAREEANERVRRRAELRRQGG